MGNELTLCLGALANIIIGIRANSTVRRSLAAGASDFLQLEFEARLLLMRLVRLTLHGLVMLLQLGDFLAELVHGDENSVFLLGNVNSVDILVAIG